MSYNISIFQNVSDNSPKDFDLDQWLEYTIKPPKRLLNLVEKYKETLDKKDKENIPCSTISASFDKIRNLENIKSTLPLICLDIDRYSKSKKKASNDCIDMLLVKELFMSHPCCYYCGHSLSGDNIYAIILLETSNNLSEYFDHLQKQLALRGINIDSSCKDYTRLRFFSYDPEAYYNPKAKALRLKKPKKVATGGRTFVNKSDQEKVEKLLQEIHRYKVDITTVYEDWIKIAGALNSEFGDSGRSYFHEISQYHQDYDFEKADKKFDQCKKMNKTGLGSLFKIATDYGVRY